MSSKRAVARVERTELELDAGPLAPYLGDVSSDSHGGAVATGVLGTLGLAFMRLADNCAMAGASMADDVVRLGASRADDVARVGAGAGDDFARGTGLVGDDAARSGAPRRPHGSADDIRPTPRPAPRVMPGHAVSDDVTHLGFADDTLELELAEQAADLGLEFVDIALDTGDVDPNDRTQQNERAAELDRPSHDVVALVTPRFADLDEAPQSWTEFVTAAAPSPGPWVFAGVGTDETLELAGVSTPLVELATACWQRGATCVFVICTNACGRASAEAFEDIPPVARASSFVELLVARRHQLEPKPYVVAVVGSADAPRLQLLRKPR